jgi:hypothetical protein
MNAAGLAWICKAARAEGLVPHAVAVPAAATVSAKPVDRVAQTGRPKPPHDWPSAGETSDFAVHYDSRTLRRESAYVRGSTFVGYSFGVAFNSELLSIAVNCSTRGVALVSATRFKDGVLVESVPEASPDKWQFKSDDLPLSSSMMATALCLNQNANEANRIKSSPKPPLARQNASTVKKDYANPF